MALVIDPYSVVDKQPVNQYSTNYGTAFGGGPVTIRTMRKDKTDCEFVSDLTVEAFRDKFVHATSENSLPKVKQCGANNNMIQDPWFYDRNFIAEYNGEPAGLLCMKYSGDPETRDGGSYDSLGCCDACGMCGMALCTDETVTSGHAYLDHICVAEKFRGKGIGKVLMEKADHEARSRKCSKIFLYVTWTNRAKHLYERQGYRTVGSHCCCGCIWCCLGVTGIYKMEKNL